MSLSPGPPGGSPPAAETPINSASGTPERVPAYVGLRVGSSPLASTAPVSVHSFNYWRSSSADFKALLHRRIRCMPCRGRRKHARYSHGFLLPVIEISVSQQALHFQRPGRFPRISRPPSVRTPPWVRRFTALKEALSQALPPLFPGESPLNVTTPECSGLCGGLFQPLEEVFPAPFECVQPKLSSPDPAGSRFALLFRRTTANHLISWGF